VAEATFARVTIGAADETWLVWLETVAAIELIVGVNETRDGSVNATITVTDCPGAILPPGMVALYVDPSGVPATVTADVPVEITTEIGIERDTDPLFFKVNVELNV